MQRLGLVTLVVPDYDAAIVFYRDILGFELVEDRLLDDAKRWVVVRPPGAETGLLLARAASHNQTAAIGHQTGGRVAFFLETDDFARDFQHYRDIGVYFEDEPRRESYGMVAVFRDSFGNRWDLIEPRN